MRLVLRSDLGGRAAALPALAGLGAVRVKRPFALLVGGNGSGKSSLFAALRQATGLTGPGLGHFPEARTLERPLAFPSAWARNSEPADLARHALMLQSDRWNARDEGKLPEDAVGVLDPVALEWTGQQVWLHDGRVIDDHSISLRTMEMAARRRSCDDRARSHGEQMTGRLRYAIAWTLGMFDLRDPYDMPDPEKQDARSDLRHEREAVPREIFARLAGHRPGAPGRNPERWLILDEPETGLDPVTFARLMAMLAEGAGPGRARVLCATHAPLALELASHPNVQVIDMDGYASRMRAARETLRDPARRAEWAHAESESLAADCRDAVRSDRGLVGQGRFTAHEAQSVPYHQAIVPPYGKPECLGRMRCAAGTGGDDARPDGDASPGLR